MTNPFATNLVNVSNLSATVKSGGGRRELVRDVSFSVSHNEVVAIVGESGCGKSITVQAIMRLLGPQIEIGGSVWFDGVDLLGVDQKELRRVRAMQIGMIFQDPMSSLNPLLSIGYQMTEAMKGQGVSSKETKRRALDLLELVGLSDVERRFREYPYELSGGMRQRVMIAMALMGSPKLLIADEPTTALDVTIQAQVISLLNSIRHRTGIAILIITHDLGVVAEIADRVVVMYAGRVVESATTADILREPRHPYTKALLDTIPKTGARRSAERIRLSEIAGTVPSDITGMKGCTFAARCTKATAHCRTEEPELLPFENTVVRCFYPETDYRGPSL